MQRTRCKTCIISKFTDLEYLLYLISYHCAPTLDRLKPASLVTFKKGKRNLPKIWEENKFKTNNYLNIKYFELKKSNDSTIVLFYNENLLNDTINDSNKKKLLSKLGYVENNLNSNLRLLREKMKFEFPHEIGIFLGYPYSDVYEFMFNNTSQCLYVGYWKVFSNLKESLKTFEKFRISQNKIVKFLSDGVNPKTYLSYTI